MPHAAFRATAFAPSASTPRTERYCALTRSAACKPSARRALLWLALACCNAAAVERLPALQADAQQVSVSGISSGGYMAVQFHIAYSAMLKGVGVIAGGPFNCARNDIRIALKNCMEPDASDPPPTVASLANFTRQLEQTGAIDATANLSRSRVWLFSGRQDTLVKPIVMDTLRRYYLQYVPASNITYVDNVDAGHTFPTERFGNDCDLSAPPFIGKCGIDGAGALLAYIYGQLAAPNVSTDETLTEFDQREFVDGGPYQHSLDNAGFVYIPQVCRQVSCRVHVAFHGCRQNASAVGDAFTRHAGYNPWAATNRIIVLYPQTINRYGLGWRFWEFNMVLNPKGCWDWWGYDSARYYQKDGPQMRAVKRMVDRLVSR